MSDAYEQGQEAFRRGDTPDMNPFDENDGQHDEWYDGYVDADAQESGDFD